MSGQGSVTVWRSALVALFSLFALVTFAADDVRFEHGRLAIETADGRKVAFSVELAVSDEQRMRGLMHRQSMPDDHGMWFDFGASRLVTMWMRNTVLPLDMLFIDEQGEVKHIRERAVPFSEELISSGGPVRYVLELNAGTVERLRIGTGSRVDLESIEKSD
ncbi:DUF192 domain-containing protein [Rhizobiaceae bacterium BDR2-2]|uniref:DUF192 domain-containing protein n=1 Tax=Ectorhizobium quercum TaxID=2965071 RepID=A0AAE3SW42_9HYPH|nr:DUF192 domain-containing protein [Ectorhizobium quercum]MCX8997599.1 DUF192 domain-containing protein [Ectorhizobium quercum]